MSLFVECNPDETLVLALGADRRVVEHAGNRAGVCAAISRRSGVVGLVDEDPHAAHSSYMRSLTPQPDQHDIRVLLDSSGTRRLIVICPRLEEWLVKTAKSSGLKMTDFGFESDNGVGLHGEINYRLAKVKDLVNALLLAKSSRILHLQALIKSAVDRTKL